MGRSSVAGSDMVVEPPTLLKNNTSLFRPGVADRCDHDWLAVPTPETDCAGGQMGPGARLDWPKAIHNYRDVHEQTMNTWVHSSVVRAADYRSAGPWLKSGCAL